MEKMEVELKTRDVTNETMNRCTGCGCALTEAHLHPVVDEHGVTHDFVRKPYDHHPNSGVEWELSNNNAYCSDSCMLGHGFEEPDPDLPFTHLRLHANKLMIVRHGMPLVDTTKPTQKLPLQRHPSADALACFHMSSGGAGGKTIGITAEQWQKLNEYPMVRLQRHRKHEAVPPYPEEPYALTEKNEAYTGFLATRDITTEIRRQIRQSELKAGIVSAKDTKFVDLIFPNSGVGAIPYDHDPDSESDNDDLLGENDEDREEEALRAKNNTFVFPTAVE